jgi:hypothetical protein
MRDRYPSLATVVNAVTKAVGSCLRRLAARRRIPAHAFGLKKYARGTPPLSSSTSHNEHTPSSLGNGTWV